MPKLVFHLGSCFTLKYKIYKNNTSVIKKIKPLVPNI